MSSLLQHLRARWVLPVDRPPIENGLVEIVDGGITSVRAASPHDAADDLGDVAIVPGLVNAHVHLEFSRLEQPLTPAQPFADWIRSLVVYRRQTFGADPAAKSAALQAGWREAAQAGTTLLGEIVTDDWSADAFIGPGPRVVAFRELIGRWPEQIAAQTQIAEAHLALFPSLQSSFPSLQMGRPGGERRTLAGLSPHAPYSVAPELLRKAVELAKQHDAPVAMHVAETRDELDLLAAGRGDLVEMLRGFSAWRDGWLATGLRPLDFLRMLAKAPRALIVHGNYLADDEIDFLATQPHLSVVYCPRTHAFFDHEVHPWRRLLANGINVALGTDGRGSNPDLSLWNELVFLRSGCPDVSPATLLHLGTFAGARALGLDHDCGSLTPGKRADIAVVSLPTGATSVDELEGLFASDSHVVRTLWAGQEHCNRVGISAE